MYSFSLTQLHYRYLVPAEHVVVSKERKSGSYHLSAYYMAKTVSELPLVITLPSIYTIITYWVAGLHGPASFFGVWLVVIINAVVGQVGGKLVAWCVTSTH